MLGQADARRVTADTSGGGDTNFISAQNEDYENLSWYWHNN